MKMKRIHARSQFNLHLLMQHKEQMRIHPSYASNTGTRGGERFTHRVVMERSSKKKKKRKSEKKRKIERRRRTQ